MPDSREFPVNQFAHIVIKPHGFYRSICRVCFQTVAEEKLESKLLKGEEMHECPGPPEAHTANLG